MGDFYNPVISTASQNYRKEPFIWRILLSKPSNNCGMWVTSASFIAIAFSISSRTVTYVKPAKW